MDQLLNHAFDHERCNFRLLCIQPALWTKNGIEELVTTLYTTFEKPAHFLCNQMLHLPSQTIVSSLIGFFRSVLDVVQADETSELLRFATILPDYE